MTRSLHIALVGLLGLLAAGQVAISLRQAVQLPSPPPLYTPAAAAAEETPAGALAGAPAAPVVATPLPSPAIATPDPANILRLTISPDRLIPHRMQAEAGSHLQLMITGRRAEACVVEVVGPDGQVAVKTPRIAPSAEVTVTFDIGKGRYRVRVAETDLEAELIGQ